MKVSWKAMQALGLALPLGCPLQPCPQTELLATLWHPTALGLGNGLGWRGRGSPGCHGNVLALLTSQNQK